MKCITLLGCLLSSMGCAVDVDEPEVWDEDIDTLEAAVTQDPPGSGKCEEGWTSYSVRSDRQCWISGSGTCHMAGFSHYFVATANPSPVPVMQGTLCCWGNVNFSCDDPE